MQGNRTIGLRKALDELEDYYRKQGFIGKVTRFPSKMGLSDSPTYATRLFTRRCVSALRISARHWLLPASSLPAWRSGFWATTFCIGSCRTPLKT